MPVVEVEGSPYKCGEQHGSEVKDKIQSNIDFYLDLWSRTRGLSRREILERARELQASISDYSPDLLEEMRGVAEGAGVTLDEVVAINGRYELVWYVGGQGGCTSIAALPEATEDGSTLLAQNWDYLTGLRGGCIILEVQQDDKPALVMQTEAGIIGQKGINSRGIGLVINAMVSDRDSYRTGVPFLLLCRRVLNSNTMNEALKNVLSVDHPVSSNMMIAQGGGVAIDIECTPDDFSILLPEEGVLTHTNHFIGNRSLTVKDTFVKQHPHSIYRYSRAIGALKREQGQLNTEKFKEILRDHYGKPNSICCHPDKQMPPDERGETLASMILNLEEREVLISEGPLCQVNYRRLDFPSLK